FQRLIRELLTKDAGESRASLLARRGDCGPLEFPTHELQPIQSRAPEPLDGQRKALLRLIGNGNHAAGKVVTVRPKMQQWLLFRPAKLPRQGRKHGNASTVLPHFHRWRGRQVAKGCFEFRCEFHAAEYK